MVRGGCAASHFCGDAEKGTWWRCFDFLPAPTSTCCVCNGSTVTSVTKCIPDVGYRMTTYLPFSCNSSWIQSITESVTIGPATNALIPKRMEGCTRVVYLGC